STRLPYTTLFRSVCACRIGIKRCQNVQGGIGPESENVILIVMVVHAQHMSQFMLDHLLAPLADTVAHIDPAHEIIRYQMGLRVSMYPQSAGIGCDGRISTVVAGVSARRQVASDDGNSDAVGKRSEEHTSELQSR